jgi:hypothetical protein
LSCSDDRDPRRRRAHDPGKEVDDMIDRHDIELELAVCPECFAPAEIVDRFTLGSTDGGVEHVKVRCLERHSFLMPAASLPTVSVLDATTGTEPVR